MSRPFKSIFGTMRQTKQLSLKREQSTFVQGKLEIDSASLWEQLHMINLSEDDLRYIKSLQPVVINNIPLLVESFYKNIEKNDNLLSIIAKHSSVDKLKGKLSEHLQEMFTGIIDQQWIEKRIAIAHKHVKIDLPTKWYMSAFQHLLSKLIAIIREKYTGDKLSAIEAVSKLLNFEQQLVLEEYEREYNRRRQVEIEKAKEEIKAQIRENANGLAITSEEASNSIEEMIVQSAKMDEICHSAAETAQSTTKQAKLGQRELTYLLENMKDIEEAARQAAEITSTLPMKQSQKIKTEMKTFVDVANEIGLKSQIVVISADELNNIALRI